MDGYAIEVCKEVSSSLVPELSALTREKARLKKIHEEAPASIMLTLLQITFFNQLLVNDVH